MKKEVRHLKVGDVLKGSGSKVISAPTAGIKTPTGKVEIGIEYPNGNKRLQTWGKYTVVTVVDPPEQSIPNTPPPDQSNTVIPGNQIPPDALPENTEEQPPITDITKVDLKFKPKEGYWDVTRYPYGGDFGRFDGSETGRIIPGNVKVGGQIRVQLADGRTVIPNASAVSNIDTDTVLELARPITKIV